MRLLRWIWDKLSWRYEVLYVEQWPHKARIVFWYRPWDKFSLQAEKDKWEKAGWHRPFRFFG